MAGSIFFNLLFRGFLLNAVGAFLCFFFNTWKLSENCFSLPGSKVQAGMAGQHDALALPSGAAMKISLSPASLLQVNVDTESAWLPSHTGASGIRVCASPSCDKDVISKPPVPFGSPASSFQPVCLFLVMLTELDQRVTPPFTLTGERAHRLTGHFGHHLRSLLQVWKPHLRQQSSQDTSESTQDGFILARKHETTFPDPTFPLRELGNSKCHDRGHESGSWAGCGRMGCCQLLFIGFKDK